MANLGAFEIPVSNTWSDLSELTGITFEADEKYRMQVTKGAEGVYVAVKDEEPDEKEGYVVSTNNPFIYIAEDSKIWIKSTTSDSLLNISHDVA